MDILVGADPEAFLKNPNSGEFVGAHVVSFPGTKEVPHKVRKGAIQRDGFAAEFNIDPARNVDEFVGNINAVIQQMGEFAPGYNIDFSPCADFDPVHFRDAPDDAKELGCSPDYSGWTKTTNERPKGDHPFRTASGHVHIGWAEGLDPYDPGHFEDCCAVSRQLDYFLGLNSLLFDADNRRRSMYGKAGAFRPKSYGMEYRVLSNVWLRSEPLMRWVYNTTRQGIDNLFEGNDLSARFGTFAQEAIDNNDVNWRDKIDLGIDFAPFRRLRNT